ncbi:MAG: glycosyltransferase family 2 protein [Endomicrobium sp.]|jgi:glycosyltransferase involved in cell wall biosynthesis|nr:glycosyltransferase family 2 protein [Endomicrobium sp.]
MTDQPLVSIVMAAYNGQNFLKKQLDSLFMQTYKNIEIIACDDCSTDSTISILKSYSSVKVLQNEQNIGFVKTFEKVISAAKGKYIALCDQDDVWLPEKIETLVKEIGDNVLIHSDAYLIDESDNIISNTASLKVKKFLRNKTFTDFLKSNSVTGCTLMLKKELLNTAIPFPKNTQYHDWWLAICAAKYGKIKYLDMPLVKYRMHASNASFNFYRNKIAFLKQSRKFYSEVLSRFKTSLSLKEFIILKLYTFYFFIFVRLLIKTGLISPENPKSL